MSENDTDIHNSDESVLEGENAVYAEGESRIEKDDGVISQGEEMGCVDEGEAICRPDETTSEGENVGLADGALAMEEGDGVIPGGEEMVCVDTGEAIHGPDEAVSGGDEAAKVTDQEAYESQGPESPEEEWGYVDGEGNIHQKDGVIFRGRIIGKTIGKNKAASLAYFVFRFKEMEDRYKKLEHSVRAARNMPPFLGKVQHMLGYVPITDALGDFDRLINGLRCLEQEILSQQNDNRQQKEELVRQAESLRSSTSWQKTAEQLKKLQAQWRESRSAGKEHDDVLWQQFRSAQDAFFQRRSEHFDQESREMEENQLRKEQLCSTAESLASSTDVRVMDQIKTLQAEWKTIGRVSREFSDVLWGRFNEACHRAYENAKNERRRLTAERERRRREIAENVSNKQYLCTMAESLGQTSDITEVKELQARWKSTGYVPGEEGDALWERFRQACNRVFDNARDQRKQQQAEWRQRTEEALERKREQAVRLRDSIARDEANTERWQYTIDNLRKGGQADEIRSRLESKICDVESGIPSKIERLKELEAAIQDMEKRLNKKQAGDQPRTEE